MYVEYPDIGTLHDMHAVLMAVGRARAAARARRALTKLFFRAAGTCMRARGVPCVRAYSYTFMKPHGYRFPTA
jgi:hypothetical protein